MVEPRAPELGAVDDVSNPCGAEECFPLSKALIVGPNPAEEDFGEK